MNVPEHSQANIEQGGPGIIIGGKCQQEKAPPILPSGEDDDKERSIMKPAVVCSRRENAAIFASGITTYLNIMQQAA